MRVNRLDSIMDYIEKCGKVSLDELCEKYNVSKNTIRRDIETLLGTGKIKKVYGGVCISDKEPSEPFRRNIDHYEAKCLIAKKAAAYVEDGDSIFIDSGSTTCQMLEYLTGKKNITIITNNLEFIIKAIPHPNINIVSYSGILNRDILSFSCFDDHGLEILANLNFTKAFLSATGVTVEYGVMNSSLSETSYKTMAVKRAQKKYLLVDRSKFQKITIKSYCELSDINYIITDGIPPQNILEYSKNCSTEIIIAD